MSSSKDLSQKINSLENMQKVMRAMNMISSIKLRRHYSAVSSLQFFEKTLKKFREEISIAAAEQDYAGIAAGGYSRVEKAVIFMFTSDKGLCGSHNSSVQKEAEKAYLEYREQGIEAEFICIGNKGGQFCKRKEFPVYRQMEINEKSFKAENLDKISGDLFRKFIEGGIQEIRAVGNMFRSTLEQETVNMRLLPFGGTDRTEGHISTGDTVTEPEGPEFYNSAGEILMVFSLRMILKNSWLSEHSARMTAMENATDNSRDLIERYRAVQNHARQTAITNELTEIVSGKEALKG